MLTFRCRGEGRPVVGRVAQAIMSSSSVLLKLAHVFFVAVTYQRRAKLLIQKSMIPMSFQERAS